MVISRTVRNILITGTLVSLAACSSSSSNDNPAPVESENTELSDSETPDPMVDNAEVQKLQNDEVETTESTGVESGNSITEVSSTDVETGNSTPDNTSNESGSETPEETASTTPLSSAGDFPPLPPLPDGGEIEVIDDGDMNPPPVTEVPPSSPAEPGSDLDRLIQGMTRQASITLLDLNRRLSQGEVISETQNKCLGSYEPSEGSSLLQIDCGQRTGTNGEVLLGGDDKPKLEYLATGDIPIYVNSTAFYNTAECSSALFSQSAENCVLEAMSLMIRSTLTGIAPPPAPGSPGHQTNLNFPGAVIEYAIGDSSIRINNLFPPINGIFSCEIDIDTRAQTDSVITGSCPALIKQMADQIDNLQAIE